MFRMPAKTAGASPAPRNAVITGAMTGSAAMMTETPTPGQIAHAAWNEAHGNPGGWPSWDQLNPLVRDKWEYAAQAVLIAHLREVLTDD
jgi:hypothetical protein